MVKAPVVPARYASSRPPAMLVLLWTMVSLVVLLAPPASSQAVEIHVTVKEEQLPGTELANLMTEPAFLAAIRANSGAGYEAGDSTVPPTPNLQFKVLSSDNPLSHYFNVDKNSGIVSIAERIDREKVCSFRLDCEMGFELVATSIYSTLFVLVKFKVTLLDINDNPPEFTQPEFEVFIPENAEEGRSFQLPTAFDKDMGSENGVKNYTLITDSPEFRLKMVTTEQNTTDVYITLVSSVNRESAPTYSLVVGATDGGLPPLTGLLTVTVQVSDINDNFPVFQEPIYLVKVPEDQRTDRSIVQVHATDADEGENGEVVYSFSPMQPQENLAFFRVDGASGQVFLSRSIESKTGQYLDLVVEGKDKGQPPKISTCTIKIFVEDTVNSMPQIIVDPLAGATEVAEVSEYAKIGKVMLHVSVRDPDSGENGRVDCHLDSPEFQLVKLSNDGKYKVALARKLNREFLDFYNVTIICSDHGFFKLTATSRFYVRVLDENDNEPLFSRRSYDAAIPENNTVGAFIIQLNVSDEDIGQNAMVDFAVMGINEKYFAVDGTGRVTAKVPLDREESDRIVMKVKVTDRGIPPLSSSTTVVVDLMDVNDMRPEFSQQVYQFEVEEEQPIGRYIGIVSASDQDLGDNEKISYFISPTVKEFVVGEEGGVLKTNVVLDRESQVIYEFYVQAVDHGVPALTGQTRVIIRVKDVNDNTPYFKFPHPGNNSLNIPHTFDKDTSIVSVAALDNDVGLNAKITYSLSSINDSSQFAIHPASGSIYLEDTMSASDVGLYILTIVASDSNPDEQRATQTLLYMDVYFDNSTLFASVNTAGTSKAIITVLIVVLAVVIIGSVIFITFICLRRNEAKKRNGFPISASTSSTTKLQGGYYIAPGVRASSSTFLNKHEDCPVNGHTETVPDMQVGNPYVAMATGDQDSNTTVQPEIVEIGRANRRNDGDTLPRDHDTGDDGQFSTFRSQENILAPGPRHDSLRRPSADTGLYKGGNDTCDDMSCDSTSDSGRGGSDVDVNNGATAAKDKARAKASTPVSVKSGISDRLSPLPRDPRGGGAFLTFRGESPSSFKFDSDSDNTLTRQSLRSRFSPMPAIASPAHSDLAQSESGTNPRSSYQSGGHSESDTDTDATPTSRINSQPSTLANMYAGGYSSGGEGGPSQQPFRVAPLPMFVQPGSGTRYDREPDSADGGGNTNTSSFAPRRNIIPRLPVYSGIDFTHHAYGGSNRNSIGAFSNISALSNSDSYQTDNERGSSHPTSGYPKSGAGNRLSSDGGPHTPTDPATSNRFSNVLNELQLSRPMSTEEDFLLPPYPEAEEEDVDKRHVNSKYPGVPPMEARHEERKSLMSTTPTYSNV